MQITLNGETRTADDGITVARLLEGLKLDPIRVAVEVNQDLVPRRVFADHHLSEGDEVEIVTFVGGG